MPPFQALFVSSLIIASASLAGVVAHYGVDDGAVRITFLLIAAIGSGIMASVNGKR